METENSIDLEAPVPDNAVKTANKDTPRTYSSVKSVKDTQLKEKEEQCKNQNTELPVERKIMRTRSATKNSNITGKKYKSCPFILKYWFRIFGA